MNLWLLASTAFLASAVEAVEALTVVLAIGLSYGWRASLTGTAAALGALAALVLIFGPLLVAVVPLQTLRLAVGLLLVLFGLGWLRKAIRRYGGRKALRNELANFEALSMAARGIDEAVARVTTFKAVFLEGLEIVVIVITTGAQAPGGVAGASLGALAAIALVTLAGAAVRAPLARVPENALTFAVGIMLTTFGTFWSGEGLGIDWWRGDLSIPVIALSFLAISAGSIALLRRSPASASRS